MTDFGSLFLALNSVYPGIIAGHLGISGAFHSFVVTVVGGGGGICVCVCVCLSVVYLRIELMWQPTAFSCPFLVFKTLQTNINTQMKWETMSKYLVGAIFHAESITLRKVNSVLNRIRNTMCGLSRWHRVAAMRRLPAWRLVRFFYILVDVYLELIKPLLPKHICKPSTHPINQTLRKQ